MAIVLASKPGLSSTTTLHIPKDWDPTWFRNFISNQLKGADVRNAIGANGISITGNISSPYATISIGGTGPVTLPGPVTIIGPAVQEGLTVVNDITVYRSAAPAQGVLYFGSAQNQYLYYTGSEYVLQGATTTLLELAGGVSPVLGSSPHTYGSMTVAGNSGAYAGIQFTTAFGTQGRTLMVAVAADLQGFYDSNAGTWDWYVNGGLFVTSQGTFLMQSLVAMTSYNGAVTPTLGALAPTGTSTPKKWIAINDNGTTRYIPTW